MPIIPKPPIYKIINGTDGDDRLQATSISLVYALKGNDIIDGSGYNDKIFGGAGNDQLYGHGGNDELTGGDGDDFYYIEDVGDIVVELSGTGSGTDFVKSEINYLLPVNVENLELIRGAVNGTGNNLNNYITGNMANNTIDGGAGADTMSGGYGNDVYIVDNAADKIFENAGEGYDTLKISTTYDAFAYTAGQFSIEEVIFLGGYSINYTDRNQSANIWGNYANNTIRGNGGNDYIDGKEGDDFIDGGSGNNTLLGDQGNDKLIGGINKDIYYGGNGNDIFIFEGNKFSLSQAIDEIKDFNATQDKIDLSAIDSNTVDSLYTYRDLGFSYIGNSQFSGRGAEVRFDNGTLFCDIKNTTNGSADFQIKVTVLVGNFNITDLLL